MQCIAKVTAGKSVSDGQGAQLFEVDSRKVTWTMVDASALRRIPFLESTSRNRGSLATGHVFPCDNLGEDPVWADRSPKTTYSVLHVLLKLIKVNSWTCDYDTDITRWLKLKVEAEAKLALSKCFERLRAHTSLEQRQGADIPMDLWEFLRLNFNFCLGRFCCRTVHAYGFV